MLKVALTLFLGHYVASLEPKNGKQLGSIPEWGPDFNVKFEITVSDFDNGGLGHPYSDVLHFTATDKTCCGEGDRLPGVFLHRDNRFIIAMWGSFDGGRGNIYYTSGKREENRWYSVEIKQEQGVFTITVDGNLEFRSVNSKPEMFKNVRVFSVFQNSVPANAVLRNLKYSNLSGPNTKCTCGESHQAKRIVGGVETEVNEYPWQVGLVRPNGGRPFCGGSIISNRHILTAAHCTINKSPSAMRVLLGEHDTTDSVADIRTISAITNHPNYDASTLVNDLSIITLTSPITFSPIMSPICLPAGTSEKFAGDLATVTGWGFTVGGEWSLSDTLQEVDVTVKTNADCKNSYSGSRLPIKDTNICAADQGKDSCNGDSGGPLFLTENRRFSQIGIVSWGPRDCGGTGQPAGVYSRVSEYKDWIKSVASGTQDSNC